MHLTFRNVNDAFHGIVSGIDRYLDSNTPPPVDGSGVGAFNTLRVTHRPSRNGGTLFIPEPVTITYTNPLERVLFNANRDANPFFHLVEALWMLAGRDDIGTLLWYNKLYLSFSDDGKHVHGAYGWRWRRFFAVDQLDLIIKALEDQNTRRAVLQMWSPIDLERVVKDPGCRDVPCNTQVMFEVRFEQEKAGKLGSSDGSESWYGANEQNDLTTELIPMYLDMTVVNRSNDLIWGTLGANYVHFSFLQEYIALACNLLVGHYHQFSKNQHIYLGKPVPPDQLEGADAGNPHGVVQVGNQWYAPTQSNHWNPDKWLCEPSLSAHQLGPLYQPEGRVANIDQPPIGEDRSLPLLDEYPDPNVLARQASEGKRLRSRTNKRRNYFPLYWEHSRDLFDTECNRFLDHDAHGPQFHTINRPFKLEFFAEIAEPMRLAWQFHKKRNYFEAKKWAALISAPDWRAACLLWLERREQLYEKRTPDSLHG